MAVDFSQLPGVAAQSVNAPSRLRWAVIVLTLVVAGILMVLILWPKDEPTQTLKFWICLIVFPVGVPVWIVLRRYSAYEGRKLDAALQEEAAQLYNAEVFRAASLPLAVVGAAVRFSSDPAENLPARLSQGALRLETRDAIAPGGATIKARWFDTPGMHTAAGRFEDDSHRLREMTRWLFNSLQSDLGPLIQALPAHLDLVVRLSVSNGFSQQENHKLWQEGWQAKSLRKASSRTEDASLDLMMLDRWLDEALAHKAQHATLLVAAQLHPLVADPPPAGTAEAGAALLLLPEALARDHHVPVVARLHRPVRGDQDKPLDALTHAMKWSGVAASQISAGWQTGLDATQAGKLRAPSMAIGLAVQATDIDQTAGYAGAAAPWLAIACAALSLDVDRAAQMVLVGEDKHFDCAVLKRARPKGRPDSSALPGD